jgi:hypothetical protein
MKTPFPQFIHGKHFMGSIPMMKECLKEKGQKPVTDKKD